MQLSLVLAVIGNLTTRTAGTPGCRLASNANDVPGFCRLHAFQHQPLRSRQGIPHSINGLADGFNISNLSSLHRKCARTQLSAPENRRMSTRVTCVADYLEHECVLPRQLLRQRDLDAV